MLEVRNVSVTLEGEKGPVEVLHDINLTLENKKIYVMTGPNGGGKSSIGKTIIGIYRTSAGQILLDGADIEQKEIHERAHLGIGYAFQQPPRFKGIKVRQILELASGKNQREDLCDLLYDVGLCSQNYIDRELNASFSGGELKRIEIATVLARDLKVAIFDEPEAGIDLWSIQRLTETFVDLREKYDMTILIISHQERILKLADQVILVEEGRIAKITNQEEILGDIQQLDDSNCRCRKDCIGGGLKNAECDR